MLIHLTSGTKIIFDLNGSVRDLMRAILEEASLQVEEREPGSRRASVLETAYNELFYVAGQLLQAGSSLSLVELLEALFPAAEEFGKQARYSPRSPTPIP